MHVGSSSPARDRTPPPAVEARRLTHWTTREVPAIGDVCQSNFCVSGEGGSSTAINE